MRIIGIDPGIRHTGYNILDGATSIDAGTIVPPGRSRLTVVEVLNCVLPELHRVITLARPQAAVVEEVAWFGTRKKITMPLSHIAGAIMGLVYSMGIPVYVLTPRMKNAKGIRRKKSWDEHQMDAAILAKVVADYYSSKTKSKTIGLRCINAPFTVPQRV